MRGLIVPNVTALLKRSAATTRWHRRVVQNPHYPEPAVIGHAPPSGMSCAGIGFLNSVPVN
jgi:hypothetical protein